MSARGSTGWGGGEDGFSMVELMITLAVASTVMTALMGVLVNQTGVERRMSTFAGNQEEMRLAVVAIQRDLRSSEPLSALGDSAGYRLRLDLDVYRSLDAPSPTRIRWLVDTAARELRREELDGTGTLVGVTYRLRGVDNSATRPLFRLFKANGAEFAPGADQSGDIARCTIRVRIELVAAPEAGPAASTLISDVHLRNRLPGGSGCPQTPVATPTTVP